MSRIVLVKHEIVKRVVICLMLCRIYLKKDEILDHIFEDCHWTKKVWFGYDLTINFEGGKQKSMRNWIWETIDQRDNQTIKSILNVLYVIWWVRNKFIHEDNEPTSEEVSNCITYLNSNGIMDQARRSNVTNQQDHTSNNNKQNQHQKNQTHNINNSTYTRDNRNNKKQDYSQDNKNNTNMKNMNNIPGDLQHVHK